MHAVTSRVTIFAEPPFPLGPPRSLIQRESTQHLQMEQKFIALLDTKNHSLKIDNALTHYTISANLAHPTGNNNPSPFYIILPNY